MPSLSTQTSFTVNLLLNAKPCKSTKIGTSDIVVDHRTTDVPVCLIYKFSYESAHNVVQRVIFNHSIMYNETIGGSVGRYIFFTVKFNSHIDGGALDGIVLSRTIYYYEWTITHKIIDIQMRIIASVISFAEKRAYMLYNIVYRILLKSKYISSYR